jgi:hypothetical protein
MGIPELEPFRLVGGTALSLLRGHRLSVDIDMFSNQEYGTIDFKAILAILRAKFPIVEYPNEAFPSLVEAEVNFGLKLNIGFDPVDLVKTDLLYWDMHFLDAPTTEDGIRLASIMEIAAMKLDVISRGGRKKDFWDLVEILEVYPLPDLLRVYNKVFPYHEVKQVVDNLCDFNLAEEVPDPICLNHRTWESIKQRILQEASSIAPIWGFDTPDDGMTGDTKG